MATFDATRLDSTQYDMSVPTEAIRLQNAMKDFMDLVRNNAAYIAENHQMIERFCELIDNDKTFPLAAIVVPELRLPQSHKTKEDTVINEILRAPGVKRRRPPPPSRIAQAAAERDLIRQQTIASLEYLGYGPAGEAGATQEEREECEDLIKRALKIVCKYSVSAP